DAPRAHLVEVADPLRLALRIPVELLQAAPPGPHVRFELSLLLLIEVQGHLLEVALVPAQFLTDALALPLERLAQVLRLPIAAFLEPFDCDGGQLFCPRA